MDRAMYCIPLDGQNDPFDSKPIFEKSTLAEVNRFLKSVFGNSPVVTEQTLRKLSNDKVVRKREAKKMRPGVESASLVKSTLENHIKKFRTDAKIACLTARWDSILMWSHYTKSHRGICIEYRYHIEQLGRSVSSLPMPVRYKSVRSTIRTIDLIALSYYEVNSKIDIKPRAMETLAALAFEKSDDWSYEREWRVQATSGAPSGYFPFPILEPVRLIIGANTEEKTVNTILESLPKGFPTAKVELSPHDYRLILNENLN